MSRVKLHDVNGIIERTKECLGIKTDAELSKMLKISPSTVAAWKIRGNIDLVSVVALCGRSISMDWLIYGNGEMRKEHDEGVTQRLLTMLESMDTEQKRDVLRYAEKELLLNELIEKRGA